MWWRRRSSVWRVCCGVAPPRPPPRGSRDPSLIRQLRLILSASLCLHLPRALISPSQLHLQLLVTNPLYCPQHLPCHSLRPSPPLSFAQDSPIAVQSIGLTLANTLPSLLVNLQACETSPSNTAARRWRIQSPVATISWPVCDQQPSLLFCQVPVGFVISGGATGSIRIITHHASDD